MKLKSNEDLESLGSILPRFLALAGGERWKKRALSLAEQVSESPFLAKIVALSLA
jgi:hypothetical protein